MPASGPDPRLTHIRPVLALLTEQASLIAIMLSLTRAGQRYDITVSKAIDEAGGVLSQYWWEVDKLTADDQGQLRRQQRWGMGLRIHETVEAAYLAAVEWVERHQAAPPTSTSDVLQ